MGLKLAINGFGRIGRNILRAYIERHSKLSPDITVVAINDLASVDNAAYLLEYDSVHGRLIKTVTHNDDALLIDGFAPISYTQTASLSDLNWSAKNVDVVLECTGRFTAADKAGMHLQAGASKVLVSAPSTGAEITVVYGVNEQAISQEHQIISAASCTTNCLVPMVKLIDDYCGIIQGFMTTIHAYTGDQRLLDSEHSDKYRSRAAALNMIPTTTGAARAVALIIPELSGKLDGVAIRVPTPNVSAVDLVFMPKRPASADQLTEMFITGASSPSLSGVLAVTDKQLVSSDLNHHPASSIIHLDQTRVMADGMIRVFSWYDNEWGFSNRMLDIAAHLAKMAH